MENKSKKVNKYLTDLKELSTVQKNDETPQKSAPVSKVKEPETSTKLEAKESVVSMNNKDIKEEVKRATKESHENEKDDAVDVIDKPYSTKDIILGVINFFSVILLIFLLVKLPQKSNELKTLRIQEIKDMQLVGYSPPDLDESKAKSNDLEKLFIDDSGVVVFAEDIEKLKSTNPAVQKVTFTNQKPIKDKIGLSGIPVIVSLNGSWQDIGSAMNAIEKLPYLFRPAVLKAEISDEDPNVVTLDYGGMLYVGDKFTKN